AVLGLDADVSRQAAEPEARDPRPREAYGEHDEPYDDQRALHATRTADRASVQQARELAAVFADERAVIRGELEQREHLPACLAVAPALVAAHAFEQDVERFAITPSRRIASGEREPCLVIVGIRREARL